VREPAATPTVADAATEPVVAEVVPAPEPEPPPEAAPPTATPQGSWSGRANNRTFALTLEVEGTLLGGSAKFANPDGSNRTLVVTGTFDPTTRQMRFAAGDEFDFEGMMDPAATRLSGSYKPRGSNKAFAWNVAK
jgi:hypothetical protein